MNSNRNLLFFMTDQQHFRTLGCNGAAEARTPNLDRLARQGVNFKNYFVTNPVCSPSRASLLTGKHVTEHGLFANGCSLPRHERTLPQVLGEHGYQTALFGKLHLEPIVCRTDAPHPYGFEICEVAEGDQQLTHDDYFRWLRSRHTNVFLSYLNEMFAKGHSDGYASKIPEACHLTSWITERAIDFLRNRRDPDRPFFLNMSFFDPHHAFNPCEPYASMFAEAEMPEPFFDESHLHTYPEHVQKRIRGCLGVTRDRDRMQGIQRAYHAMMAHVDKCLGDVLAVLEELGLSQETAVVHTSDHGEMLGNHGMLWKGPFMFDDLLRVPLFVSVPGRPMRGIEVEDLVSGVDLMPTLLSLAGLSAEFMPRMSGRPVLAPDLTPLPENARPHVLAEWENVHAMDATRSIRCIRTPDCNHWSATETTRRLANCTSTATIRTNRTTAITTRSSRTSSPC